MFDSHFSAAEETCKKDVLNPMPTISIINMGFSTVFFIFLIFLAVRSSRFSIDIPFRRSEETPKQKPFHFITGLWS